MLNLIRSDNFETEVLEFKGIVLVDFFADWCGPCRMLMPIIEELAEKNESIKFAKINVDESKELAEKFDIRNLPTLIMFNNGKVVARKIGSLTKFEMENLLKNTKV
ncbi:MAG: thioredoxin [Holosporales bacterium]|jgi:thioredoxin 1|nr:thioredoxin [Holosporales bacterium]